MNCSNKAAIDSVEAGPPPVLVAEGGIAPQASRNADPITAWMQLMDVVEALCPQWLPREPMIVRPGKMRL